jgi:hypothetical protein
MSGLMTYHAAAFEVERPAPRSRKITAVPKPQVAFSIIETR